MGCMGGPPDGLRLVSWILKRIVDKGPALGLLAGSALTDP